MACRRDSASPAVEAPVKITKHSIEAMESLVKVTKKFGEHYSTGRKDFTLDLDRCNNSLTLAAFGVGASGIMAMLSQHAPQYWETTSACKVERFPIPVPQGHVSPANGTQYTFQEVVEIPIAGETHYFKILACVQRSRQLTRLAVTGPLHLLDWTLCKGEFAEVLDTEESEGEYRTRKMGEERGEEFELWWAELDAEAEQIYQILVGDVPSVC